MKILSYLWYFALASCAGALSNNLNAQGKVFYVAPNGLPSAANNAVIPNDLFHSIADFYYLIARGDVSQASKHVYRKTQFSDGAMYEQIFGPRKSLQDGNQLRTHQVIEKNINGHVAYLIVYTKVVVSEGISENKDGRITTPLIVEDRGVLIDIWIKRDGAWKFVPLSKISIDIDIE